MLLMRHRLVAGLFVAAAIIVVVGLCGPTVSGAQDVSLNALEQEFTERMANSVLVGRFVVTGSEDSMPRPERYEIEGVTKVGEDQWRFDARIQYGDTNVTLPVVVTMLWAGDTPMVSVTDLTVLTLGTFTARVIFYRDRYAGTWQHGEVGGHLFGAIEKAQ